MDGYRLDLRFRSSYITPLHADTLFGHLCWAARYVSGENRLEELLAAFAERIPLVLSDGFPSDTEKLRFFLPAPLLPTLGQSEVTELMAQHDIPDTRSNRKSIIAAIKAVAKLPYLELQVLQQIRAALSARAIFDRVLSLTICPKTGAYNDDCQLHGDQAGWQHCPVFDTQQQIACDKVPPGAEHASLLKNTIDRLAGGTLEGRLFSVEEKFPRLAYSVYLRLDPEVLSSDELREWLAFVERSGFGKDKSTGKGAFSILAFEPFEFPALPETNAFLSLSSSYVPRNGDPRDGYYELHVKRGKLGGHYALERRPWKRPVIMFRAGSVFFWQSPREALGDLVKGVHQDDERIVQYGCAYPLPARLEQGVAQ